MNIGDLRHRVELHSPTNAQNAYGEETQTWASYATVWAEIVPLAGRELEHAKQISAETSYVIRIRYNSSVAVEHRVIYGSRTFEITAVMNFEERNIFHDLYCKEIT